MATRAHNYAVLTAVFLPPDVAAFAMETTGALVRAHIDAEMGLVDHAGDIREAHKNLEAIGPRIQELENRIRAVLAPTAAAAQPTAAQAPSSAP